jgi:osmotically-inducible protein OsmY
VNVNNRLATLASNARFRGVDVRLDGRTAYLSGQVDNESDKRMAVLLVRLEPGVSTVVDETEVAVSR